MTTQITTAQIRDGAITAAKLAAGTVATFSNVSQGRLTLTSNTPVTTSDVFASSSLYYTPHQGSGGGEVITLWDGSALKYYTFTQKFLNMAAFTANKNYDIWGYPNAGDLALDYSIWTSDTARATAIALQNNMWTKSGDPTRKLLGTIRITGTAGQCEDSAKKRFVWNCYNRFSKPLICFDTTYNWVYSTDAWRAANANTTDGVGRFAYVVGLSEDSFKFVNRSMTTASGVGRRGGGIGIDSTTVDSAQIKSGGGASGAGTAVVPHTAIYHGAPGIGYHFIQRLERNVDSTSITWWGNDYVTVQSGMTGEIKC